MLGTFSGVPVTKGTLYIKATTLFGIDAKSCCNDTFGKAAKTNKIWSKNLQRQCYMLHATYYIILQLYIRQCNSCFSSNYKKFMTRKSWKAKKLHVKRCSDDTFGKEAICFIRSNHWLKIRSGWWKIRSGWWKIRSGW